MVLSKDNICYRTILLHGPNNIEIICQFGLLDILGGGYTFNLASSRHMDLLGSTGPLGRRVCGKSRSRCAS